MVTGAASGIGRAIALALAKEGADLFLVDIDRDGLAIIADEARGHGVDVIAVVCDLADSGQIGTALDKLRGTWNALNILVNNAGITYYGQTHLMTAEQRQRIMAVNLTAPMTLVHELLPMLLSAEEAHIVNVCSIFGLATYRKAAAYQASKFGLVGFTAALRAEYWREDFGVTALCPGFVRSALLEGCAGDRVDHAVHVPAWLSTTPEKTAARALRAIRGDEGVVLVTPMAHLYWRLARLFPGLVDWVAREGWRRRGRMAVPPSATSSAATGRVHAIEDYKAANARRRSG